MTDWPSFYEAINEIKFTMLVTHDEAGLMQARPFTTQVAGREGAVWFFTRTDSDVVADIRRDENVLLCYADSSKNRFISSSGTATLSHDKALISELWKPAYTTFFPAGVDDPALCLLRVQIAKADIWDSDKSAMERMVTMAKAAVGIKVDKDELGEHAVLKK
ncbi:pyridoxamine 5'-phosphate oxidase family protein [Actimicrobium antarcticum]|uniref:Pyridoxamine 5'-phosphate oxidase family protein n=1 Tax=Actimicrobium antarcticum TaxID=1051899 RepID=A0ABP7SG81_9BURK